MMFYIVREAKHGLHHLDRYEKLRQQDVVYWQEQVLIVKGHDRLSVVER